MTSKEVLVGAKALIADRENWYGQGKKLLKNEHCSLTAVLHAARNNALTDEYWDMMENTKKLLAAQMGGSSTDGCWTEIMLYNDTHSHADVMAAFDRAIAGLP